MISEDLNCQPIIDDLEVFQSLGHTIFAIIKELFEVPICEMVMIVMPVLNY